MTRFLLDTHAVVHWQLGTAMPPALSDDLDVASRSGLVLVSAAAFWEISLLARKGRLESRSGCTTSVSGSMMDRFFACLQKRLG